jgi:hypothetical protein
MNRRRFISSVAATAGLAYAAPAPDKQVKRVLVMFKCHLDVGFVDTQAAIVKKYFDVYFPQAIQLAEDLRKSSEERYVWTTGSWLIYQYLEQAAPTGRKRMERALTAGDVAWHALPFTWQTELLDEEFITGAIGFSKSLDKRFGRVTTGAKMTDVPGHCRGLIKPLSASGVKLLNIGVNSASTPPDVPDAFLWKDPEGASLVMLYHRKAYGGVIRIPHSDLAIAVEMRDDNAGPHTPEEIHQIYAELKQQFPLASISAASLADIANAVEPFRAQLPVVTQEIGDTWIYGAASDPLKLARFRELQRLRTSWLRRAKLKSRDTADMAFLSKLSLAVEHTWGTDTKTWLDFDHYTPADLAGKLDDPKYRTVTGSWIEKRKDIDDAVASLPSVLRDEANVRLAALTPRRPATSALQPHDPKAPLDTAHFIVAIDPESGAIHQLRDKITHREWASPQNPMSVLSYQTFSKDDYDRFLASYITLQTEWAPKDFGKPNIEKFGAQSRLFAPKLKACWMAETPQAHRLLSHLQSSDQAGWPEDIYIDMLLPKSKKEIRIDLSWFGKRANRLPEALWITFNPLHVEPRNWRLHKLGRPISPYDVVSNGGRHLHAVNAVSNGDLRLETLDAALVALSQMSPIYFSKSEPELLHGVHVNLFNNAWGTNYVQWFGEDMRFRFVLGLG